jgi:hypothetical protein
MIGAIEGLIRTEAKLSAELGAKKTALQSQGRTTEPGVAPTAQETPPMVAPTKEATPTASKPVATTGKMTKEQMINSTIEYQKNQFNRTITRAQAEQALRNAGKL